MKKSIFLFTILFSTFFSIAQPSVKTGRWMLNNTIVTRQVDSIQIEEANGIADTIKVKWTGAKTYTLQKAGAPDLFITITKVRKWGYAGTITDGISVKPFELICTKRK